MINIDQLTEGYSKLEVKKSITPFMEDVIKEVKDYSKKDKKKMLRIIQGITVLLIPQMFIQKTQAQTISTQLIPTNVQSDIIPPEVMDIMSQLISSAGKIGILLAILLLIVTGILKMLGQSAKARKMSVDIIKGFGQVMLAPIIILLISMLTRLMLGGIDGLDFFF